MQILENSEGRVWCVQRSFLATGGSITHLVTVSQIRFTVRFTDGMIRELVGGPNRATTTAIKSNAECDRSCTELPDWVTQFDFSSSQIPHPLGWHMCVMPCRHVHTLTRNHHNTHYCGARSGMPQLSFLSRPTDHRWFISHPQTTLQNVELSEEPDTRRSILILPTWFLQLSKTKQNVYDRRQLLCMCS